MAQTTSELEESLLIRLLTTSPDRRLTDSERKAFDAAHEDYIDALQALSQDLRKSPLEILHRLIRADARLCRLKNCICDKHSLQASLLKSAIQLTNFEIRLIFTRLRYPSIADPVSAEVPKSPLFLSEQFTATLRSHTPHRRHTDRSGDTCRCAFRNFQRPYQQSGTVSPCRRQP